MNQKKPRATKGQSLQYLRHLGLSPTTVFDVGVHAQGTPELYTAFPKSRFVLIEPVREHENSIKSLTASLNAEYVWAAASKEPGRTILSVRKGLTHSQIGKLEGGTWSPGLTREIEVVTLDGLAQEKNLKGPFLVKVDVDGRDIEVLQGASEVLKQTDCVVIESVAWAIPGIGHFLGKLGFFLWDIVDMLHLEGMLWQVDLVFLNERFRDNSTFDPWARRRLTKPATPSVPIDSELFQNRRYIK